MTEPPSPFLYAKPLLKGPVLLSAPTTPPLGAQPQAFLLNIPPGWAVLQTVFPRWLQQDLPSHLLLQCDTDRSPIDRHGLHFLHSNLGRLVTMAEEALLLPPGPLGTLTLGTQLPCCKEAQTAWRGNM